MVNKFYEILYSIFDEHVPKAISKSRNHPPWFDKELLSLKNLRNKEYKKLCKKRRVCSDADNSKFILARDRFNESQSIKYNEYIKNILSTSRDNPRIFWQYINSKRSNNSLPCKLELDGEVATDDANKAKLLAKFLSSVYVEHTPDEELDNFIDNRIDHGMLSVVPSHDAVMNVLIKMDTKKGMSTDMVSPLFLRRCAEFLAEPLSIIFEKSLVDGIYPDKWKISQITPIHKAGQKSNVRNYRGVSVMPTIAKVFEKVVFNQLKMVIMPQLSDNQHGFLPNRNIDTNLMEFSVAINDAFEKNSQLDVFYADISKAFDTVNQHLLIRKLAKYPLSNAMLKWFKDYFKDRKQFVRVGLAASECFSVPSSVGQGSILGPVMFLVFFDDSDDDSGDTSVFNFADDKKVAKVINNASDANELQRAIDRFINWCKKNGLEVNISKCKIITFTHKKKPLEFDYFLSGHKIDRVIEIRDLGVQLDTKLSFAAHREIVKKKAMSRLSFVRRVCRSNMDEEVSKLLYSSLVRSNLEFACSIWSPTGTTHRNEVESVQKQAVIFLNKDYIQRDENNYQLTPYIDRCMKFDLKTLVRRRIEATVLFMHKIISGRFKSTILRESLSINEGTRTLRNPEFIKIKFYRSTYAQNSPFNVACRAFNHAALFIDPTLPIYEFERMLKKLPDVCFGELCKL